MNGKRKKLFGIGLVAFSTLPLMAVAEYPPAQPLCDSDEYQVPISGKVLNDGQVPAAFFPPADTPPDIPFSATLGTVALVIGKPVDASMKCGIVGFGGVTGPIVGEPGKVGILFRHTFSCDDKVTIPGGLTVHSQVTLDTIGKLTPTSSCSGTFTEYSTPALEPLVPNTNLMNGRGIFTGVQKGWVKVDGTLNCASVVDMKFSGYVCLPAPPQ